MKNLIQKQKVKIIQKAIYEFICDLCHEKIKDSVTRSYDRIDGEEKHFHEKCFDHHPHKWKSRDKYFPEQCECAYNRCDARAYIKKVAVINIYEKDDWNEQKADT